MRKVWLVIKREYLIRVKTKGFASGRQWSSFSAG
jgi:ABC-type Na+ efflux pump permease subunit